jgi:uncharacterized protein YPO0396
VQKCSLAKLDNDDLKAIKDLIEVTIDERLDEKLNEKSGHLPTKDEFYGMMDKVMGELKAIREEIGVLGDQVSEHADRLDKLVSDQETSSN